MNLFDIPSGTRIKINSSSIRWIEHGSSHVVGDNFTYEATTTNRYSTYAGAKRRLLINHTIDRWKSCGIWQSNKECEIISLIGN